MESSSFIGPVTYFVTQLTVNYLRVQNALFIVFTCWSRNSSQHYFYAVISLWNISCVAFDWLFASFYIWFTNPYDQIGDVIFWLRFIQGESNCNNARNILASSQCCQYKGFELVAKRHPLSRSGKKMEANRIINPTAIVDFLTILLTGG